MAARSHRVILEGEWDLSRKDELETLFTGLQKDGPLTIDLQGVTFADSTFLHQLAALALRFQEIPITLVGPSAGLLRLLGIVQFDRLFQIVDHD